MSIYGIEAEGKVSEQGKMKSYSIDINFSIDDLNLEFEGYLANPRGMGPRAVLDSFSEFMREGCHEFVERNDIKLQDGDDIKDISGAALYGSVMEMILEAVNNIKERGDSLFIVKVSDTELRKARRDRKDKIEEIERLKSEEKELDMELEKQKVINETKKETLEKMSKYDTQAQHSIESMKQESTTTEPKKKEEIKTTTKKKKPRGIQEKDPNDLFGN